MISRLPPIWLALGAPLALAAGCLGWLMLGLAGDYTGRVSLMQPDARSEVLTTPTSRLTFAEVRAFPPSAWTPWEKAGFAPAAPDHSVWMRVTLRNPGDEPLHGIYENADPHADRAEFFDPEKDPRTPPRLSGENVNPLEKAIYSRSVAFPVSLPPHGERTVYIRLQDNYNVWLSPAWWPAQESFYAAYFRNTLAGGVYFGLLLALIFYNAVLWVRLRFPDTGRYLLYLTAFTAHAFFATGGLAMFHLALGSPWMEMLGTMAFALSGAFLAEFARTFLDLPALAPRADRVARFLRNLMAALVAVPLIDAVAGKGMFLGYVVLIGAVTHLVLFGMAIWAWRAGARQARYFVLAFGVLLVGMTPAVAAWIDVVSLDFLARAVMLGSALQMLLLSAGTADRFAHIQRDKLRAQEALLEEIAQRQAIQEAYADELATEVRERTAELSMANGDKDRMIAVLGHDLRSPLIGLTQTAEQLSAGATLARHEHFTVTTARTGRQLLLMIEDLALWAQLRAGSPQIGDCALTSIIAPAITLHQSLAEREGVELVVDAPGDLKIRTDLVLAQTLVRNLVANAIKFANSRAGVRAAVEGDHVRITISDDGPGLPCAAATELVTGTASSSPAHGGLGLRLCREIGQSIGTRFEVSTPRGGGTEISFFLPARL